MENQKQLQMKDNNELTKLQTSEGIINNLLPKDFRNIQQAITSNLPSIAKIKKSDPEAAKEVINEFISDFVQFLNVGKTMNALQISQTSDYILQYFPHFNLADFKVFFDKMKIGQFGKFYDSVDGQLILSKLEEYSQQRMEEYEILKFKEHKELKRNSFNTSEYHPKVIQALKDAIGEKKPLWGKETIAKEESNENIGQKWLRQFDNLFLKYGKVAGNVRFLVIGNTRFSIEKFIERKTNNYYSKES